ncbi:MAG: class I mannose-6-phosphate isomerase [Treponema sp.]|jgi:mannose-6-phosphate isomerase class I|nr:class I mannose-6-phosphate isomerase [Treponema sp.]
MQGGSAKFKNYDLYPHTRVPGCDGEAFTGYEAIVAEVERRCLADNKHILVCDLYPGADEGEILSAFMKFKPRLVIRSDDCAFDEQTIDALMRKNMTADRVFGIMTTDCLEAYFDSEKIAESRRQIAGITEGFILIIGVGAALIPPPGERLLLLYFDMERWEIQIRYRKGMANWKSNNHDAPFLLKYKRGYFIEWRLADRHKKSIWDRIDYYVNTNTAAPAAMITKNALDHALSWIVRRPFRTVPYFDPGVWGGQWMKENFGLDRDAENYAWSFDGVPEENSLRFLFGGVLIKMPCQNLVLFHPGELLGDHVHGRFGTEFPIRFDMLDTMGGQNLSLQVHPLTEYIQEEFNMRYTQDESYYILDTGGEESCVYLGLKTGIDRDSMVHDLYDAEEGKIQFPAERYVNTIPVKKHDHVLIPAGTIHCSGKNTMVLEISATPYIFTFKLWDWGRLGLDGIPRPVHLEHGIHNIQWNRDTEWVYKNLINQTKLVEQIPLGEENNPVKIEKTGLHKREFIDTYRYTFNQPVVCETRDSVNMLNLVEGAEITVESVENSFEPLVIHYAETFIIPACVETFRMRPSGPSDKKTVMVIQALVR